MCEKKQRVFSNNDKKEEETSLDCVKRKTKRKQKILETYQ